MPKRNGKTRLEMALGLWACNKLHFQNTFLREGRIGELLFDDFPDDVSSASEIEVELRHPVGRDRNAQLLDAKLERPINRQSYDSAKSPVVELGCRTDTDQKHVLLSEVFTQLERDCLSQFSLEVSCLHLVAEAAVKTPVDGVRTGAQRKTCDLREHEERSMDVFDTAALPIQAG